MIVNGKNIFLEEPISISEFLQINGYLDDRVAVEKNKIIIPRRDFDKEQITDKDSLEIVTFVGGG